MTTSEDGPVLPKLTFAEALLEVLANFDSLVSSARTLREMASPPVPSPNIQEEGVFSPFTILGVRKDDSMDMINAVYRAKAKILHPDNLETGDETRFKQLHNAYEIICALKRER